MTISLCMSSFMATVVVYSPKTLQNISSFQTLSDFIGTFNGSTGIWFRWELIHLITMWICIHIVTLKKSWDMYMHTRVYKHCIPCNVCGNFDKLFVDSKLCVWYSGFSGFNVTVHSLHWVFFIACIKWKLYAIYISFVNDTY